mmetsp:Transcript_82964/g.268423  ORF Transcript_82964/g.268423 Transcript_82964/m.268423 type:complete len:235 (+) Transcript_82964:63-767(+)
MAWQSTRGTRRPPRPKRKPASERPSRRLQQDAGHRRAGRRHSAAKAAEAALAGKPGPCFPRGPATEALGRLPGRCRGSGLPGRLWRSHRRGHCTELPRCRRRRLACAPARCLQAGLALQRGRNGRRLRGPGRQGRLVHDLAQGAQVRLQLLLRRLLPRKLCPQVLELWSRWREPRSLDRLRVGRWPHRSSRKPAGAPGCGLAARPRFADVRWAVHLARASLWPCAVDGARRHVL